MNRRGHHCADRNRCDPKNAPRDVIRRQRMVEATWVASINASDGTPQALAAAAGATLGRTIDSA